MKVTYYDHDYDKWCFGDLKTAVIEDNGIVRSVYGDNVKCIHLNDEPGKCPTCGKDSNWLIGEMLFGGLLLALAFGGLFCMGIYIYKSLF